MIFSESTMHQIVTYVDAKVVTSSKRLVNVWKISRSHVLFETEELQSESNHAEEDTIGNEGRDGGIGRCFESFEVGQYLEQVFGLYSRDRDFACLLQLF